MDDPVVPPGGKSQDHHQYEKQTALNHLLDAVKQCQVRFGGKSELATDMDSRVSCLCSCWENVLQHGMKHTNKALSTLKQVTEMTGLTKVSSIGLITDIKNMETEPVFWHYVREYLSKHEVQRYTSLKSITTDAGRGRAWLRSTFNEHSLEKYLHMLLENESLLKQHYEDWAFLRDQERSSMLTMMAAGLGSILFAINIDNGELNSIKPASGFDTLIRTPQPVRAKPDRIDEQLQPVIAGEPILVQTDQKKEKKKRKKKLPKLVSFDEDSISCYSSSPSSAITSPTLPNSSQASLESVHVPPGGTTRQPQVVQCVQAATVIQDKKIDSTHRLNTQMRRNSEPASTFVNDVDDAGTNMELRESLNNMSEIQNINNTTDSHLANSTVNRPDSLSGNNVRLDDTQEHRNTNAMDMNTDIKTSSLDFSAEVLYNKDTSSLPAKQSPDGSSLKEGSMDFDPTSDDTGSVGSGQVITSRIPRISSQGSLVRVHSQSLQEDASSMGSADLSASEVPADLVTSDLTPVGHDFDSTEGPFESIYSPTGEIYSGVEEEIPVYGAATENAAFALQIAQKGLASSYSEGMRTQGDGGIDPKPPLSPPEETMSTGELRQAVVAMMLRKDEVEDQNNLLKMMVEQEQEMSAALRAEIGELKEKHMARQEEDQSRIRSLTRENDVLKHQLKKYVSAVQMLRRQGAKVEDIDGIHLEEIQPAIPPPKPSIDYSYEASEYEKKLVQVAEMHGELMEFNEMIRRQLTLKEAQVRRLRDELTHLRGPLPEDLHDMDANSLNTEGDGSSVTQPLVNIWIPSAFLKGSGYDAFHVYQIFVRIRDEEWNVYRRYTDFLSFHTNHKKRNSSLKRVPFPPKKTLGSKDPKFVEERRKQLERYLRQAISLLLQTDSEQVLDKANLMQLIPFLGEIQVKSKKKQKKKDRARQQQVPTT